MSRTASRYYAFAMALTNLCAALLLAGMFAVNAMYAYASLFVTLFAPLAALSFALIACMWVVRAYVPAQPLTRIHRPHFALFTRWRSAHSH